MEWVVTKDENIGYSQNIDGWIFQKCHMEVLGKNFRWMEIDQNLKKYWKKKKADKTSNDTHIEVVSFKKTMYV